MLYVVPICYWIVDTFWISFLDFYAFVVLVLVCTGIGSAFRWSKQSCCSAQQFDLVGVGAL